MSHVRRRITAAAGGEGSGAGSTRGAEQEGAVALELRARDLLLNVLGSDGSAAAGTLLRDVLESSLRPAQFATDQPTASVALRVLSARPRRSSSRGAWEELEVLVRHTLQLSLRDGLLADAASKRMAQEQLRSLAERLDEAGLLAGARMLVSFGDLL